MSRDDPILRVRIPDDLRATLKARAEKKRRTMTQEIVDRLQKSVDTEEAAEGADLGSLTIDDLAKELETLRAEVRMLGGRVWTLETKHG